MIILTYFWISLTLIVSTIHAKNGCNNDNCLRAMIKTSSIASQFCSTVGAAPTVLPATFKKPCGKNLPRYSSACSCLMTATASSTIASSTSSSKISSSSSSSTSSIQSSSISSTSSSASPTASAPPFPSCEPTFTLSGVSEDAFNPAGQSFQLVLSCSELDTMNYTVYSNWKVITGTTNSSSTITIPGQPAGSTLLTVLALDLYGTPILNSYQLLFGSATIQVLVVDANGIPHPMTSVQANATTYLNIGQSGLTDANGSVTFVNVPPTTIGFLATTEESQIAVDGLAGSFTSLTLQLSPLLPPVNDTLGFEVNNGTSGWTGGSSQTISKRSLPVSERTEHVPVSLSRHSSLYQRDVGLVLTTAGSESVQTAYKSFILSGVAKTTFIVYKFQTNEFPGGYFGTKYNDYYSVTIRADDGAFTSIFHSMNELGAGAFDSAGYTQWYTVQMDVSKTAKFVEYNLAVSNVADALYQSQLIVQKVGVCDKCATCDECPQMAKCQDICLNPPLNSCAFYQSCAEETLGCGPSGFPLAYGLQTCNKFANSIAQFSPDGKTWFVNTEQCLQQALIPLLSCEGSCDAAQLSGFDAIPICYNANNFCSLKGMDYVLILTTLKDDLYRKSLKSAVTFTSTCAKDIVKAITLDIQQKVADAAAGTNYLQSLADAHALAIAMVFYKSSDSNGALPDIDTAVKYIKQVYDTASSYPLASDSPNLLAMDYLRSRKYNDYQWSALFAPHILIDPAWLLFADFEGLEFWDGYPDPASPSFNLDLDHLYATMEGAYLNGDNTRGDTAGWLGDLYTFYGDWQHSGVASGSLYCQQNLGQNTPSTFPMADLRQDADGYNSGMRMRNNPSLSLVDEFKNTVQGGGYTHRFSDFWNGRFGGSTTKASSLCMSYMTDTIMNPEAWTIRRSLTRRFYKSVKLPEDIPRASLQDFCDGFAGVLQGFAASG